MKTERSANPPPPRGGWGALFFLGIVLSAGVAAGQEVRRGPAAPARPARELWLFFSPSVPGLARELAPLGEALRRRPDIRVRPAFLSVAWDALGAPTEEVAELFRGIRSLQGGELSVAPWDPEALRLAREVGIDRLPAYALVEPPDGSGRRTARVAQGFGVKFEGLLR